MKGTERRRQILEWLSAEGSLGITEIAERFGISKMTVHRDLELLEGRQALKRIHGGVVSVEKPTSVSGTGTEERSSPTGECLICRRPASQHLHYSLTLVNGDLRLACCPHCGVSAQILLREQVAMAMTADYLSGQPHPVQHSFFLLGSAASPCCHPSVLTFKSEEMARRFQTGFGGRLGRLEEAIRFLQEEMALHRDDPDCPHCAAILQAGTKPLA